MLNSKSKQKVLYLKKGDWWSITNNWKPVSNQNVLGGHRRAWLEQFLVLLFLTKMGTGTGSMAWLQLVSFSILRIFQYLDLNLKWLIPVLEIFPVFKGFSKIQIEDSNLVFGRAREVTRLHRVAHRISNHCGCPLFCWSFFFCVCLCRSCCWPVCFELNPIPPVPSLNCVSRILIQCWNCPKR